MLFRRSNFPFALTSRAFLAIVVALLLSAPAFAVGEASCVSEYQFARKNGQANAVSPSEAADKLGRIANAMVTSIRNIVVVPCEFFNNKIVAWNHIRNPDDPTDEIESGEYIVYSPEWLRTAIIDADPQAVGLFAHELAHFANRHWRDRESLTFENEAEADEWAGCALARLKKDPKPFEELLMRIRGDVDSTHPSGPNAVKLVRKGYERCEGRLGTRTVYFVRSADGGAVERALQAASIDFETQPSKFTGPVNALTCTKDVPPEDLRKVARALVGEGIRISAIFPSSLPSPRPRITIETYDSVQSFVNSFSLEDIDELSCEENLNKFIDPQNVKVSNNCALGPIRFYIGVYDENGNLIFRYRDIDSMEEEVFSTKSYQSKIWYRKEREDVETGYYFSFPKNDDERYPELDIGNGKFMRFSSSQKVKFVHKCG